MTTELTAQQAWKSLCEETKTQGCESLVRAMELAFPKWWRRITAERDKDVESLRTALRHATERESRMTLARDTLAEDARRATLRCEDLQAELDRLKPKPRKTAGEKLLDLINAHTGDRYRWEDRAPKNQAEFDAAARALQSPLLTDDPEPPTDGELTQQAIESFTDDDRKLSGVAAEFLRLRAERDGGEA